MATAIGSVSVSDAGAISGSGLARELLEGRDAAMSAELGSAWNDSKLLDSANVLKAFAALANADAQVILDHLTTNAQLEVTNSDAGLQRDPSSGTATLAPSSTVTAGGIV